MYAEPDVCSSLFSFKVLGKEEEGEEEEEEDDDVEFLLLLLSVIDDSPHSNSRPEYKLLRAFSI